jgi:acyl dehydratase
MAVALDKLGTPLDEVTSTIDADRAQAYAAATVDDNEAYTSGKYAPPVFGVVPTWESLMVANAAVIPAEAMLMVVHGEQDMWFHQPLVPGMTLRTRATPFSVRVGGSGTRFTSRIDRVDENGRPVLEIYGTTFIRGMSDGESAGPDKPDHTFPDDARSRPTGEFTVHLPEGITYRYSDASGDLMPIHLDENVARSVGLPGIIVHGLCTMAVCSQAVVKTLAGGDPARLKRLAVRFATNVFPDSDVTVSMYEAGDAAAGGGAYAFEAHSRGDLVISNGRAEVER